MSDGPEDSKKGNRIVSTIEVDTSNLTDDAKSQLTAHLSSEEQSKIIAKVLGDFPTRDDGYTKWNWGKWMEHTSSGS